MKVLISVIVVLGVLACSSGCAPNQADFVEFLRTEIASLGGRTNGLSQTRGIYGEWTVLRDASGTVIDTQNIAYDDMTNLFIRAYGDPILYVRATERTGPTYAWPATNVGIAIFISTNKNRGVLEITLTKPIRIEGLNPEEVLQEFKMKEKGAKR